MTIVFGNFVCQYILHTLTHRCYKTDMMNYCGIVQRHADIITYYIRRVSHSSLALPWTRVITKISTIVFKILTFQ